MRDLVLESNNLHLTGGEFLKRTKKQADERRKTYENEKNNNKDKEKEMNKILYIKTMKRTNTGQEKTRKEKWKSKGQRKGKGHKHIGKEGCQKGTRKRNLKGKKLGEGLATLTDATGKRNR